MPLIRGDKGVSQMSFKVSNLVSQWSGQVSQSVRIVTDALYVSEISDEKRFIVLEQIRSARLLLDSLAEQLGESK